MQTDGTGAIRHPERRMDGITGMELELLNGGKFRSP